MLTLSLESPQRFPATSPSNLNSPCVFIAVHMDSYLIVFNRSYRGVLLGSSHTLDVHSLTQSPHCNKYRFGLQASSRLLLYHLYNAGMRPAKAYDGDAIHVMSAQPGLWWWYEEARPLAGRPSVYRLAVHIFITCALILAWATFNTHKPGLFLPAFLKRIASNESTWKFLSFFFYQYNRCLKVCHGKAC
jgi:hypothetical protein